jgi:hypothetical protein
MMWIQDGNSEGYLAFTIYCNRNEIFGIRDGAQCRKSGVEKERAIVADRIAAQIALLDLDKARLPGLRIDWIIERAESPVDQRPAGAGLGEIWRKAASIDGHCGVRRG